MDKIDFLKIRYVCTSQDITIMGNKQRVANRRTSVPRACLAKDAHPGGSAELRRPKGNGAVSKRAEAEQVSREAQESEHAPRDLPQGDKAVSGHRHFCRKRKNGPREAWKGMWSHRECHTLLAQVRIGKAA